MNYWLIKTEPNEYSWNDLVKLGRALMDHVRNYRVRMQMKNVKAGDLRFFYRSVKQRDILGAAEMALVRIVRFSFPPFSKKEDAIIMNNGK